MKEGRIKVLLWLDDIRDPNPSKGDWLVFSPIEQPYLVRWCKNYDEFVYFIISEGLPDAICFDHDLGIPKHVERVSGGMSKRKSKEFKKEEKTGYDCALWLVDYCLEYILPLPKWNIQSQNPVGKENIKCLLENYEKHYKVLIK